MPKLKHFFQILGSKSVILVFFLLCVSSGCVRFTGHAGVWKQGSQGEEPAVHQVDFDTNQLLPKSQSSDTADITT